MDGWRVARLSALSAGAGVLLAGVVVAGWRASGADRLVSEEPGAADPMAPFCAALSGDLLNGDAGWYESALSRPPDRSDRSDPPDPDAVALATDAFADSFVEATPPRYHAGIRSAAEGLTRAVSGRLTADEARVYVASFVRLRRQAAPDCRRHSR